MPNCPLAEDCPSFSERIQGMGCQHYDENRGGAEWCQHYGMPIDELKQQPVKPGQEVVVAVDDIHESGAGVGSTEDGFIVFVDGLLPPARAKVRIDRVKGSHARAKKIVERLPMEDEDNEEAAEEAADDEEPADEDTSGEGDDASEEDADDGPDRPDRDRLGSRENFWGG
ncbi:TRAM domain-containing protein [Halonotius terrestris]|uniref:TRAM domain-containing protein n=1 Tax=Halonotius terrestris TaxID=2487750 RepID=A0A8J8TDD6_9EURY|nr:TRAM domain-containing protein [Halonotius terrestris]TQQ82966.1 TRAM domain-containing protein [Halonotius terrestris]